MDGDMWQDQHEKKASDERRRSLSTWISAEHWRERILTFNASWFIVPMGTGAVTQTLYNFPYPAQWLRNLGYCFWILCIILFLFFTVLSVTKLVLFPHLVQKIFYDFSQVSYLGAFIISLDNIIIGIVIYYDDSTAAIFAAYALFWVAIALTVVVGCAAVLVSCCYQQPHEISEISGVWLISFIPFIVTSAVGSTIVSHLNTTNQQITLAISFLSWSLGQALCYILLCLYFWRLLSSSLPARDIIVSCYIPIGPTGEGAYSIQNLAVGLGTYIQKRDYLLSRGPYKQVTTDLVAAVAESIHWLGVLIALFLVAFSTFWLVEATGSVILRIPKRFNVGFWSFVFPVAVYTNALSRLALDLNNPGFSGWAATCTVLTVLVWLGCALMTLWKGVWKGELFFAPDLEGWDEKRGQDKEEKEEKDEDAELQRDIDPSVEDISEGSTAGDTTRTSRPDGTYSFARWRRQANGTV